jgi:hypothetical protein
MLGRDLDILPADVAVGVLILDANVRKVNLLVEERQAALARPLFDLFRRAVGPAVAVAVAAIALLQEALILPFQLAVEFDAKDARLARLEPFCGLHVRAIELRVVGALPRAIGARVEGLAGIRGCVSMALEQTAAVLRQRDRAFPFVEGHALHETLPLERPDIIPTVARIAQIPLRDDPKRPNGGERPRFGSLQGVVTVAIAHELAIGPVWQIKMPSEHVSRIERAIIASVAHVAVPFVARVIVAAPDVVIRFRRKPATGAPEREALTVAVANAVISLA